MKRSFQVAIGAVSLVLSATAFAQSDYSFDDEVNAELNKMYDQGGAPANNGRAKGPQVQVNVQSSPAAAANAQAQAPVQQTVAQAAVQTQPTTIVQASPVQESKAESLRKNRQDAEVQTEQKIVEKLEESRLKDEQRRSEVLFGDKFNQLQNNSVNVVSSPGAVIATQQQQPVAPVAQIAPAPPVVEVAAAPVVKQEVDKEGVRNEVRLSLEEMKAKEKEGDEKKKHETYVSALVGVGDYPDVQNIRSKYAAGLSVGSKINDRLLWEGSFIYSQYDVYQSYLTGYPYPTITQMNQYGGQALVKYQIFGGIFRPVIGGVLGYTYRTYKDEFYAYTNNQATSQAVDAGVMAGADLEVSDGFSIGLDVRYMWNLTSQVSNQGLQQAFSQNTYGSSTPVESLSYMTIGLVGRATF